MNPEETPFFRKELTEETHKSEGERVRGVRSGRRDGTVKEDRKSWHTPWENGKPMRAKPEGEVEV